jgi:hypothetical protein
MEAHSSLRLPRPFVQLIQVPWFDCGNLPRQVAAIVAKGDIRVQWYVVSKFMGSEAGGVPGLEANIAEENLAVHSGIETCVLRRLPTVIRTSIDNPTNDTAHSNKLSDSRVLLALISSAEKEVEAFARVIGAGAAFWAGSGLAAAEVASKCNAPATMGTTIGLDMSITARTNLAMRPFIILWGLR